MINKAKNKFYRQLKLDKQTMNIIKFFREWKQKVLKEERHKRSK
jgi:hypothetical protein